MPKTKRKLGRKLGRKRKTVKHRRKTFRRVKKRSQKMRGGNCSYEEDLNKERIFKLNLESKKYVKKYNDLISKCSPSEAKKEIPIYKREERKDCKALLNPSADDIDPYEYLNIIEKRADTLLKTINEKDIEVVKEEFETISSDFNDYTEKLRELSDKYISSTSTRRNRYGASYSKYLCFKPKFDDISDTLKHIELLIKEKECDSMEIKHHYIFEHDRCEPLYIEPVVSTNDFEWLKE